MLEWEWKNFFHFLVWSMVSGINKSKSKRLLHNKKRSQCTGILSVHAFTCWCTFVFFASIFTIDVNPSLLNTSPHFLSRLGDFVDLSEGPLIPYSSLCFQFAITAAHPLKGKDSASEASSDTSETSAFPAGYDFHRFQGLSLPVYQRVSFLFRTD